MTTDRHTGKQNKPNNINQKACQLKKKKKKKELITNSTVFNGQ